MKVKQALFVLDEASTIANFSCTCLYEQFFVLFSISVPHFLHLILPVNSMQDL